MKQQNIRILSKVDTINEWISNNPVLLNKEIGYERETGKYKIGNGNDDWNSLSYAAGCDIASENLVGQKTENGGEIFNDYENNVALAEYTHVSNKNNRAGHCGYKILNIIPFPDDAKRLTIFLKDNHLETPAYQKYNIGDLLNFSGSKHYQEFLKIENVIANSAGDGNSALSVCIIDECSLDNTSFTMEIPDNKYENWISVTSKNVGEPIPLAHSSHAEGESTIAIGRSSHTEGRGTIAIGSHGHAEGKNTKAGYAAHAEGQMAYAIGDSSHAEGFGNKSYGASSHSEGKNNIVTGNSGHAEGAANIVNGAYGHAEGYGHEVSGYAAHAEGDDNVASGPQSHTEGYKTTAKGIASHSEGHYTIAGSHHQHVQGKYNIEDTANKYAHIVGNGHDNNNRSNAHTIDWDGNAWFAGDVKADSISLKNTATALNTKVDKVEGKGLSANDYTDMDKLEVEKISSKNSITIGLNESVPEDTIPSICNFKLIPETKRCHINILGEQHYYFYPPDGSGTKGLFHGDEVPLLTTKGNLKIIDSDNNIKLNKELPELINWEGISDELNNTGLIKRWSRRFYISRNPDEAILIEGSNPTNTLYRWFFTEDDFENLGIPKKATDINFISPVVSNFNLVNVQEGNRKAYQSAAGNFRYDPDTDRYIFEVSNYGNLAVVMFTYAKWYFCYELAELQIDNTFLIALGLSSGDKVVIEKENDLKKYYDVSMLFKDRFSWEQITDEAYFDLGHTIEIVIPTSLVGNMESFTNVSRMLNNSTDFNDIEINDYQWIGDGDGSSDYTDKLQNKIDEVHYNGGGTIYLGSYIYPINKSLVLYNDTDLIGNDLTVIEQKADNTHALILSGSNIQIKNLTIKLSGACDTITGCIYINSDNVGVNYDGIYPENKYVRYCTIENVKLKGTYEFGYDENGAAYKPDGIENYRGVGIYSTRLYWNWCNVRNTVCSNLYAGVHGGSGNNIFEICSIDSRMAVYENGGQNLWTITGHTYYATNSEGKNISLTDMVVYGAMSEYSVFDIRFYDIQYVEQLIYFSSMSMGNMYSTPECITLLSNAKVEYEQYTVDFNARTPVIDMGRGNRNISPQKETQYAVGGKIIDITGQASNRTLDGAVDNILSGAGIWGNITSNIEWENNGIDLSGICRYPKELNYGSHYFASIVSKVSPSEDNPIEIIIDITDRLVNTFTNLWIQFDSRYVGSDIRIDWYSYDDIIRTSNICDNVEPVVNIMYSQAGIYQVTKIKLTVTKALSIEELNYRNTAYVDYSINYNPDNLIGIVNIGMAAKEPFGRAFLGECGGNLYGNVDMHNNTFKNVATPTESNDAVNKSYVDDGLTSKANKSDVYDSVYIDGQIASINMALGDITTEFQDTNYRVADLYTNKANRTMINNDSSAIFEFEFGYFDNTETRICETKLEKLSFTFADGEYGEDYMSGLSFDSGEIPTAIDYTDSGILNWVGTDCVTSNGLSIFQPSPNTHYDIVFYFNGSQIIGLVNGFVPATGNVVSE